MFVTYVLKHSLCLNFSCLNPKHFYYMFLLQKHEMYVSQTYIFAKYPNKPCLALA